MCKIFQCKWVAPLTCLHEKEVQITIGDCHMLPSTFETMKELNDYNFILVYNVEKILPTSQNIAL